MVDLVGRGRFQRVPGTKTDKSIDDFCDVQGDILNEYFGKKATKQTVYIGLAMSVLAFIVINIAQTMPFLDVSSNYFLPLLAFIVICVAQTMPSLGVSITSSLSIRVIIVFNTQPTPFVNRSKISPFPTPLVRAPFFSSPSFPLCIFLTLRIMRKCARTHIRLKSRYRHDLTMLLSNSSLRVLENLWKQMLHIYYTTLVIWPGFPDANQA